jgi:predicted small lipoprotein YifL
MYRTIIAAALLVLVILMLAGCGQKPAPVAPDTVWQEANVRNQLCTQVEWQYIGEGVLRTPTRHGWLMKSGTPAVPDQVAPLMYVPDERHEWKVGIYP